MRGIDIYFLTYRFGIPGSILAGKCGVDSESVSREFDIKLLRVLGDCSFGIYFSHLAVMSVLGKIPYYSEYLPYPVKATAAVLVSMVCVLVGNRVLGKYGKFRGQDI